MANLVDFGHDLFAPIENALGAYIQKNFPDGNVPEDIAHFSASATALLSLITKLGGEWTKFKTGADFLSAVKPLTETLSGFGLAAKVALDVDQVAAAIDSGDGATANAAIVSTFPELCR